MWLPSINPQTVNGKILFSFLHDYLLYIVDIEARIAKLCLLRDLALLQV